MNTAEPVQKFYRFHPITGQDANDLPLEMLTEEQRIEVAAMVRAGAKFYWDRIDAGEPGPADVQGYTRIEKANVLFVLRVTGLKYEFIDSRP